jgi:diguanylate cyclase (GGDEF)-like protein
MLPSPTSGPYPTDPVHDFPLEPNRRAGRTFVRPRRWRVGTRLACLIVVCLVCVGTMAISETSARVSAASRAGTIQDEAARLGRFVDLRSSIHAERVAAESLIRAPSFDLADDAVEKLIGLRPHQAFADARAATDRSLRIVTDDDAGVDPATLDRIRAAVSSRSVTGEDAVSTYTTMDDHLRSMITDILSSLEQIAAGTPEGGQLLDTLNGVRAASVVLDESNIQMSEVEARFLKMEEPSAVHDALVVSKTRGQISSDQLDSIKAPAISDAWQAIRSSEDLGVLRSSVDATIALPVDADVQLDRMVTVAKSGLQVERRLYGLVSTAMEAVRHNAEQARNDAIGQLWAWVAFSLLLVFAAVLLAVRIARSISVPVRRLGSHAAAVSGGNLDVDPLTYDGPADIAETMEAFDDLVANLRLLEGKAQALAACEFDSPILSESLPGRLGASLQRSVQVLSGSIVERDELQRHLSHQATHDSLTGLYNRAAGAAALEQALRRSARSGSGTAVLFIDLDDFKQANDTYGHAVGDRVLQQAAERLGSTMRSADVLARLGGDEFMVIAENIGDPSTATDLARRVAESFRDAIQIDGVDIPVGACVGIALARDGHDDPDQLLAWADLAVYRAKHLGRNQIAMYDESLQRELIERAEIHAALTHAIAADELVLHYQPVLDSDGAVSAVEALVRWERPGFGMQPPDSFIPVAESSNLIIDLDCWVLDAAARQLLAWDDVPELARTDMSVNISGRHLMSGLLPGHIRSLLDRTGLDPNRLIIEVTETVLIGDLPTAGEQLTSVRALGVRVAIDDFGTGYTSVTHLQKLPVDVMKIDRSFVNQDSDERSRTLLAMMIDVGHHLGMTITAEGVETSEQLQTLNELACDRTQGYLLCRPLTPERLCEWLVDETSRIAAMQAPA